MSEDADKESHLREVKAEELDDLRTLSEQIRAMKRSELQKYYNRVDSLKTDYLNYLSDEDQQDCITLWSNFMEYIREKQITLQKRE